MSLLLQLVWSKEKKVVVVVGVAVVIVVVVVAVAKKKNPLLRASSSSSNLKELGAPNPGLSFPWVHSGPAAGTASGMSFADISATTHVKRAKIPRARPILPSSTTLPCWQPVCAPLISKEDFDGFNNKTFLRPKLKLVYGRWDLGGLQDLAGTFF